jgi:hypothetical protein
MEMPQLETPERDRIEMVKGAVPSLVINLGFLLIAKGDQRILLLLFASVVAGVGLLLTPRGALGMGLIIGAMGASVIALCLAGFLGWSPLH